MDGRKICVIFFRDLYLKKKKLFLFYLFIFVFCSWTTGEGGMSCGGRHLYTTSIGTAFTV